MSFLTSSSKIAALEQQLSELQTSLTSITGERDLATTNLATITGQLEAANGSITTLTAERDQAKEQVTVLTGERDELKTSNETLTGEVATLKNNTSTEVRKQIAEAGVPAVERVDNPQGTYTDANGAGRTKTTWARDFTKR